MSFTYSLKEVSLDHFEYNGALTPSGLGTGTAYSTGFHIEKISNGNFVLKVTPECHITSQYNKKGIKIRVASIFSVMEDTGMALKPSIEICEEVIRKTWEYTKDCIITESTKSHGIVIINIPTDNDIYTTAKRGISEMY